MLDKADLSKMLNEYRSIESKSSSLISVADSQIIELDVRVSRIKGELDSPAKDSLLDELRNRKVMFENELIEKNERLRILEKTGMALDMWIVGFGPTGLRDEVIIASVDRLNELALHYSHALTNGEIVVEFQLEKGLKSGSMKREVTLGISNRSGSSRYVGQSSGESKRIALVAMFSLVQFARERAGGLNVVFLDEVFNSLDQAGIDKVGELLIELGESGGSGSSVFVVTHQPILQGRFETTVVVTKEENGSYITLE